jgi:hypothetical protein
MSDKESFLVYGDGDKPDREEIKKLVKERDRAHPNAMPNIISTQEMKKRVKRGLPTDNYVTVTEFMRRNGRPVGR